MAIVITPETDRGQKPTLFLAGTIEMGKSIDWQSQVIEELNNFDIVIANPRRGSFDQFDKQEKERQINWELDKLNQCSVVLFNFLPETISPISLLEFGLLNGKSEKPMVVCCPEGYSRRDNVLITAAHSWSGSEKCEIHSDLSSALESVKRFL